MEHKHSKLGIASSVIGVVNIAGLVIFLLYISYYLDKSFDPDTIIDAAFSSIFAGILFVIILFAGFLMSIISLFQKTTKKLFGVLGLTLAIVSVIIIIVLVIMVSLAGPRF